MLESKHNILIADKIFARDQLSSARSLVFTGIPVGWSPELEERYKLTIALPMDMSTLKTTPLQAHDG